MLTGCLSSYCPMIRCSSVATTVIKKNKKTVAEPSPTIFLTAPCVPAFLRINGNTAGVSSWLRTFVPRIHTWILKTKGQKRRAWNGTALLFGTRQRQVNKASRQRHDCTMQSSSLVPAFTLPATASPERWRLERNSRKYEATWTSLAGRA